MNLQEILNTIRDNASQTYQERVPEATRANIQEVGEAISDPNNAVVANEFMSTLLNMIIKPVLHEKLFSNPLKQLKKGKKPLGDTIEEIYTNFIKAETYDQTGANLLKRNLPDTKTVFHRMNRQDKYKITSSPEALAKAFASWGALESYLSTLINTLYNSSELDEYVLTKQLIKDALDNNAIKTVIVPDPLVSAENGKEFIKAVKIVSGDMVYPNDRNNAYLTAQSADDKPIVTFSRKSEQILIIDNATEVSVNVDVLASVFNMTVAEFNDTRKITIDAFPDPDVRAVLVDEAFFQIYDDLLTFREFENGEGLYKNYILHVWQTLAYSILVNAVAFTVGSDEDDDKKVETFDVTYTLKTGVKSSNRRKTVAEGGSYTTTLTGVGENDTVTVTMGTETVEEVVTPIDITSEVYDAETGKIEIDTVTDDIAITVA
ncbi:MAG: hypothetical protein J6T10_16595 [Methanobrevibacter sp.]|nr:hypothetical protein [Methanobrevibacter sp.]